MSCARHGADCPFGAEARRLFDAWVELEKKLARGEVTYRVVYDAHVAYHHARDERLRECEGVLA